MSSWALSPVHRHYKREAGSYGPPPRHIKYLFNLYKFIRRASLLPYTTVNLSGLLSTYSLSDWETSISERLKVLFIFTILLFSES